MPPMDVVSARLPCRSTYRVSGELNLRTNAAGVAEGTVNLGALAPANRSLPYETVSISADWIGPTRELISQSAIVK